jgi:hypothetical protein
MQTVADARRVLEVVDAGLVKGLGQPVPGQMCVEAAICYALGLPHGDDPACVSSAVRLFKIALNDKVWSSPAARAKGMRALSVAQLGSKGTVDDVEFSRRLAEATIRQIVPIALRAAAERVPSHAEALEAAAVVCERDGTREAARATAAAYAAAAYAADAAYAAAATAVAATAVAYAAAAAYTAEAAANAAAAAAAYTAEAAAANANAAAAAYARDIILTKSAFLAFDVLREMGAPGVVLWDEVNAA